MGPPDKPGDDDMGAALQKPSDGLEQLKPGEGEVIAPDDPDRSEDKQKRKTPADEGGLRAFL